MIKNIIVTGSSGFIGINLSKYFSKFYEFSLKTINKKQLIDLTSIEKKYNAHTFIHLIGKAHDLKCISNPQEYYEVNTELTKKVFDAFLDSDAKVFITLSSVKAVADTSEQILTEDFIPNPLTHYGKSKRLAEEYILANLPKDKRVYILRPCMVHGEGNKGNLTLLYNFVKKGIPYPLGAYDNKRSFLSVENLCFVIKELIERNDISSGIYHVADDDPVATKDLIKLISEVTNKKILIWEIPKFIINLIAKIGDYLPLPLNTERVMKMTENYVVSNQKIKSALGKNLPVSSEDGLRKTIESFNK
ncbi:nucleoside-diphosphate-sugar epimerase [Arcicella aurantiaca]|uniref:Nucleoside-diphosphate-sugar epimerase n=1 Tax=Arcicella aurantiaca TaxID=591202 RepID=A0A316EEL5_9BACT|nr:NAD-dependent epimerase/dehydratase family protein [Arcicella aurantiaca]PWK21420.1 nucleoside-diphosphate-sugar epimerase [Arcicella aurantiaca]